MFAMKILLIMHLRSKHCVIGYLTEAKTIMRNVISFAIVCGDWRSFAANNRLWNF